jgi:uncharacterized repeat protein (TIGR02543 family)
LLTVVSNPEGGGSVTFDPPLCANHTYAKNVTVTLTAVASKGYQFDNWTGDIGSAPASSTLITVLMDQNRTIHANFAPSDLHYTVTASSEPEGGGSVEYQPSQPAGGYQVNESISVFANPQDGYVFSRWTGDLAGTDNPRTILASENKSIMAVFDPTVTVYCSPTQGGSYVVDPESSSGGYAVGTRVTISVEAAKGYRFAGWEGDGSGSDRSITLTVDGPRTVTARFAEQSSRWWLWIIVGLIGVFAALILVRLVYARMNTGVPDEPQQPDE